VTLLDDDLMTLSIKECADRVGYVMQNPNQMISKTMIFDEIALGLKLRGFDEETISRKVEDVMRICGLYEFRKWPVSALSYGQKKRVTIASILALDPQIIILDEPTAGQDFRHYTDIMEFLKEINDRGITIIMITHDMHLMLEYAERAVVFTDGRIIADMTSAEILTNPEIIEKASLKETSLYHLALMCGIEEPSEFVQHFINYDREVRS
jgi:energy-coupling factor transport system ATP-binding protein